MMKKILGLLFAICLLAACTSESQDVKVDIVKDLYYVKDKETSFTIKVTEGDKAVTGLSIQAVFNMTSMDHGTYEVELAEDKDGMYSGEVGLSMAGDWEVVVTFEKDGETVEKVINYKVKESGGVATINGEWITEGDIEFYSFINKLHIALSREKDQATYKDAALEEAMAYWDAQEKLVQDRNQLLTQVIRLRSMALLAEEKGHKVTEKEVAAEIDAVKKQYETSEVGKKLIAEYGEEKFWAKEQSQYKLIVLSQKVQEDLIAQVKKENPDVNNQEIYYLAQKKYEELLVSQVNSLKIEFL